MAVAWPAEHGWVVGDEEARRTVLGGEEEGAPVANPAGLRVGEHRGISVEMMRALIRLEELYGELSTWRPMAAAAWSAFRRLRSSGLGSSARMSFGGVGRVSPWCLSAKNAAVVCCPRGAGVGEERRRGGVSFR